MKTNIGVIFGGRSTEHEISVISASQAMAAIDRTRYDVTPIYLTKEGRWWTGDALLDVANYRQPAELLRRCTEVYMRPVYGDYGLYPVKPRGLLASAAAKPLTRLDVVIPVLHGTNMEDGVFEGVLQTIGIPYAGCNVLASANGMDKITMKMILRANGVPVVDYVWFSDKQWHSRREALLDDIETRLGYPVIVKPANLGSSVGIGSAHGRDELARRIDDAERYSTRLIVEHMLADMQEINCSVLGDADDFQTSVLEEPIHTGDFLTYEKKYMGGGKGSEGMQSSQKRIPAELPADVTAEVRRLAGETFRVLSCHGVSRVDVMIDRTDGRIYVNEINTIPGSLSFYLWEASGLPFDQLMDRLVKLALRRKREEAMKTVSYSANIFNLTGGAKSGPKLGSKSAPIP